MVNPRKALKIIIMAAIAASPTSIAKANNSNHHKGNYKGYFKMLGDKESSGDYSVIGKYGYLGKYQMGEMALVQAGFYEEQSERYVNSWNGLWTDAAQHEHVASKEAFLHNKQAQEAAVRVYTEENWKLIKYYHLDEFVGKEVNGIDITVSGLLAGAHLVGVGGLRDFLRNGQNVVDGNGVDVSTYIIEMGGYNTPFDNEIFSIS